MGAIGPIPWTAIREYTKALELDRELAQDVHYLVRAMDEEYLKWARAQVG